MSRNQSPNFIAGGNVYPARFIKADTTDNQAVQAGANARTIGISSDGTKQPPGVTGSDGYIAHSGENLESFGLGDVCLLTAGSGGWTAGDQLESDGGGAGVTSSTTLHNVGAIALETVSGIGVLGRVQVVVSLHA